MAKHYFSINDFELVKAMHEDGVDVTMEGLGPWVIKTVQLNHSI